MAGIAVAELMPDGVTECHLEDFFFACSDNNVYGSMEQARAEHPDPNITPIITPIPTPEIIKIAAGEVRIVEVAGMRTYTLSGTSDGELIIGR